MDASGNVWLVQAHLEFSSTTGLLVFAPQTAPFTSVLATRSSSGCIVFLSSGECPLIPTECWSHPGSYLQSIGAQQFIAITGGLHLLSIAAGPAHSGFVNVTHTAGSSASM